MGVGRRPEASRRGARDAFIGSWSCTAGSDISHSDIQGQLRMQQLCHPPGVDRRVTTTAGGKLGPWWVCLPSSVVCLCVSAQRSQSACPSSGSVSVASELIVGSELYLGNKARSAIERVRVRTRASTSAQSSVLSASASASAACHHRWAWDAGVPAGA